MEDFMNEIEIDVGNRVDVERVPLGLYSLDIALGSKTGKLGMPLRSLIEVSGRTHVGKSTTTYYMAGVLASTANKSGKINIVDLEGLDIEYLKHAIGVSGFKGKVNLIDTVEKGRPRMHSAMLQEAAEDLYGNEDTKVIILDSIGAFISDAEWKGDIGEAFMGKRAQSIGQWGRKVINNLINKPTPASAIYINHTHSILAGHGTMTAGGDTIKYLSAIRMVLWQKEVVKTTVGDVDTILGYRVGGTIEKLKFGNKNKKFELTIIPEYGVSKELSALYDAANLGLIERGATVKVDGKSIGYISKLFEAAVNGNTTKFDPIFEKLEEEKQKNVLGNPEYYKEIESDKD
ncbi:hypothetical protein IH575_00300 [Candidatus Dojkabacteria bacterium]|nr:hypothetical protein [Candidatus Dojkabacteria bacterium]